MHTAHNGHGVWEWTAGSALPTYCCTGRDWDQGKMHPFKVLGGYGMECEGL